MLFALGLPGRPVSAQQPAPPTSTAAAPAVPAGRQAKNVAIITIYGEIDKDGVMATSVERRINTAVRAGADAIVFDLNTPGGELGSVLRICNLIKSCPIQNTVGWVNPDAYSGGAIIAMACRELIVNDPSTFGDAMPIGIGGPLQGANAIPPELLKKMLPPLISEVLDSARRYNTTFGGYHRDEYLVQSIVANDVELWFVRNKETGQKMCIDREEFAMLFPDSSSEGPTRLASVPGSSRPSQGTAPAPPDPPPGQPAAGAPVNAPSGSAKLAAIAAEVEQNQSLRTARPRLTAADAGVWELTDKVTDGSGPALFKADDMLHYGFAANETQIVNGQTVIKPIRSDADIVAFFQAKNVRRLDSTWSEGLVLFLTHFVVRGILIVIFLLALFIEMTHPGAMVPGLAAFLALVALVAPPMLIGMASWWEVVAILVGIVLIGLEAFVIPGFGIAGILGLALLFAGLVATFVPAGSGLFPDSPRAQSGMLWGMTTILLAGATAGMGMYLLAKHFGSLPVLGKLVLKDPGTDDESDGWLQAIDPDAGLDVRPGQIGTTLTPMRPSGRIEVGDKVIDAVAEFGFIPAGSRVRIVSTSPLRTGVELVPQTFDPSPSPGGPGGGRQTSGHGAEGSDGSGASPQTGPEALS